MLYSQRYFKSFFWSIMNVLVYCFRNNWKIIKIKHLSRKQMWSFILVIRLRFQEYCCESITITFFYLVYQWRNRGGGQPQHMSPPSLAPPHSPHLTSAWSWLWIIFLKIFPIKKKRPNFFFCALCIISNFFLVFDLKKVSHLTLQKTCIYVTSHEYYNTYTI